MKQLLFYFFILSVNLHAQTWHTMGIGVQKNILSEPCVVSGIINFEGNVIIAGNFKKSSSTILNGVAKWDGNNWLNMGIGTWVGNGASNDSTGNGGFGLCSYNNNLIIAGSFLGAGGLYINDSNHLANGIAKWNGSDWFPLTQIGDGINNKCSDAFVFNNHLYLGGFFGAGWDSSGVTTGTGLLRWNDTTFSNVGNLDGDFPPNGDFAALAFTEYQDKLIMGGYFTSIDGSPFGSYSGIAAWNDTAWSALGGGFNDAVFALAVYNGTLYAGGKFTATADNLTPLNHIAKWNGTQWLPVGEGFNGDVYAICGDTLTNNLYAGGSFTQTGTGFPANHISRWNGTFWQELYYGTNDDVYALYAKDSNLYVGGKFTQVGTGTTANCIAVWGYQAVGIEEQGSNKSVQVFPNPNSGIFRIILDHRQFSPKNTEIKIFNALGALIHSEKMQNEITEIRIQNAPKGMYFIQIQANNTFYTSKVLIE